MLSNAVRLARYPARSSRSLSTTTDALDNWIRESTEKRLVLRETLHTDRLADLYATLPTRDGTRHPYRSPQDGSMLGYGHHLSFFHPRTPEKYLRPDGTDADFCPPEPFVRRMWAGGRMEWRAPLVVGQRAVSVSSIDSVAKKGFERGSPMVFVTQRIEVKNEGHAEAAMLEERSHVYLALGTGKRSTRKVEETPPKSDFSFTYTPSLTTLFRFSALTFNGHHIHLDRDYAQVSEGYPERLVHGPLTALVLLETLAFHKPGVHMRSFDYRALNPVIVNRACTIHGAWEGRDAVQLWAVDEEGVVGMRGRVTYA